MAARHARQIDNVSENLSARKLKESRQRRARQSYVQLEPGVRSQTRESERVYTRRLNRGSLIEDSNKKHRIRMGVIAIIVIVAALIVATVVAVQVFMRTTDSRLAIADDRVSEALIAPSEDQPFYMLCLADLRNPMYSYSTIQDEASMLVRVDEAAKTIGFISFPSHMYIKDADDEDVLISSLMEQGDYVSLVKAVSSFMKVDISHLALTDFGMLEALVDEIGGIEVNVPQEIDDPLVGNTVIHAGDNSLNGAAAMEFIRATNLMGGFSTTAKDRALFTTALIAKAIDSSQIELATVISDASKYVDTDWKTSDILSFADSLKPFDSITFFDASIPCEQSKDDDGQIVYTYKKADLEEFLEIVKNGGDYSDEEQKVSESKESDITIEVRNGAGIDGAAATLGVILENNGYKVLEVGNTNDDTIYPETLVVFTGTGSETDAEAVIRDIGAGRAVEGGDFYSSKADVIVIIGSDWN